MSYIWLRNFRMTIFRRFILSRVNLKVSQKLEDRIRLLRELKHYLAIIVRLLVALHGVC